MNILIQTHDDIPNNIPNGFQYTVPDPIVYPYQWLWDSCYHAIVLSHFSVEDAQKELLSLSAEISKKMSSSEFCSWLDELRLRGFRIFFSFSCKIIAL